MKKDYLRLEIPEGLAKQWFRSVGAEIVIRCKNCEHWHHDSYRDSDYCELTSTECEEDHFCSWGEKKNDA